MYAQNSASVVELTQISSLIALLHKLHSLREVGFYRVPVQGGTDLGRDGLGRDLVVDISLFRGWVLE